MTLEEPFEQLNQAKEQLGKICLPNLVKDYLETSLQREIDNQKDMIKEWKIISYVDDREDTKKTIMNLILDKEVHIRVLKSLQTLIRIPKDC